MFQPAVNSKSGIIVDPAFLRNPRSRFGPPRRALSVSKLQRWTHNIDLLILNSLVLRLLFPAAAVGIAYTVAVSGWGLFNRVDLPYWLEVLVAVLLLDLVIYLQHLLMHRVPLLWRLPLLRKNIIYCPELVDHYSLAG